MENLLPAQQGDAQAQLFVGYLYETGQGVRQNYTKAAHWYRKAAEQGNAIAQIQLGNMYRLGKGVPQNYILAYMWFDISARGGNANAKDLRRVVAGDMSPAEIAEAKRMSAEWRPGKR
jgi:TPR repeat protein